MPNLRVSILGLLQLHRNGTQVDLGSPQQQSLFVALLMREGRTATAGNLIEALWGDNEPASARRTLRTYAWRLRKILEEDSRFPSTLVSVGDGYRLVLDGDYVDFLDAEHLARSAYHARRVDDLEGAYDRLEAALALWRGEPLAAIPGPFATLQRDRLNEVRLVLQEELMETGLALGHGIRYLSELPGLIDRYPLRERLYTLLMHAQYQSGRRAEALDTYRRARDVLVGELGVEPGPELHALHQRVLAGCEELLDAAPSRKPHVIANTVEHASPAAAEPSPTADEPTSTPPGREDLPSRHPAQLPPDLIDFTGRSHLTLTIASLLNSPQRSALPVSVLLGMAGVGKSALAVHVAHTIRSSYPDGQLYANLRAGDGGPVRPDDVLAGFIVSLGYCPDDVPATLEARTALLRTVLNGRRVLLVLDDAVDVEQVRPLLPGSAECGVLITTRTRLAGLAALHVEVPAFYPSEALDLLKRTLGAERVEAERTAALEMIESCAMLPLAIRIVAARLAARPHWSLRSLSNRLSDEFKRIEELRSGSMTLSTVFDLTYRHLPEDQAKALRRAATVDSPSLSLTCAAALMDMAENDAEVLLDALVDQAMLESPAPGRYRFHALLRDFARRKTHPEEQRQAVTRLLDFLLASAKNAFAQVVADPMESALSPTRSVGRRFANAAEARGWAAEEGECALGLVRQLARMETASAGGALWDGPPQDALSRLRSCVDLLIVLGAQWQTLNYSFFQDALDVLQAAVTQSRDLRAMGRVHFLYAGVDLAMGRYVRAEQRASEAVRMCDDSDDPVIMRQALNDLGLAKQNRGDFQGAIECYDRAIELARRLGHARGELITTVNVALLKVHMGEPGEAEQICRRVLAELVPQSNAAGTAYVHYVLGLAHHRLGSYESAVTWFENCLALCTAGGLRVRESHTRLRLAESLAAMQLYDRAAEQARLSVELYEDMADTHQLGQALRVLGQTLRTLGQESAADECLTRADELVSSLPLSPEPSSVPTTLSGGKTGNRP
ncbi:AfsR/SARP family transcriptional regulator [Streptomyces sp. NPDC088733]|uniref:AfsR/SARP family transcriptional regulator n=1 Tax=Streptomyces sp. NPDC088733 TaxID=3365880 RepID=UPI00382C9C17